MSGSWSCRLRSVAASRMLLCMCHTPSPQPLSKRTRLCSCLKDRAETWGQEVRPSTHAALPVLKSPGSTDSCNRVSSRSSGSRSRLWWIHLPQT